MYRSIPRLAAVLTIIMALGPGPSGLVAQAAPESEVVDRIVAVVGDSVVLLTQLQEELQRLALTQNMTLPEAGPQLEAMTKEVLDTWVNRLLVLQEAENDSLIQTDESQVDETVSGQIDQVTQQFGGPTEFQQALAGDGLTLAEYREILRQQVRQEQIQQLFLQSRLRDAPPVELSEEDLLSAFQAARGQLQQRPKLITFDQVVLQPEASAESKAAARAKAESLLERIQAGEDFAELARRNSEDPGSAQLGGDLGWFRRGRMVKSFEDAAFALMDDEVSGVVESEFGFHIIKVERSRAGERRGRHILIIPDMTDADLARTRVLGAEVVASAKAGVPMHDLAVEHADPAAPDSLTVPFDQISELPPGYEAIQNAAVGDVVGPVEYKNSQGETRLAVIKIREIREAGAYTFEDVRAQLADQLKRQKQIAAILETLRSKTHIEIRM
jgi:peptidyl-prolyl cis-trans isomerase SurA